MHCKQADSAILKLLLVQASMGQICLITKQIYVLLNNEWRSYKWDGMGYTVSTGVATAQIMKWGPNEDPRQPK